MNAGADSWISADSSVAHKSALPPFSPAQRSGSCDSPKMPDASILQCHVTGSQMANKRKVVILTKRCTPRKFPESHDEVKRQDQGSVYM